MSDRTDSRVGRVTSCVATLWLGVTTLIKISLLVVAAVSLSGCLLTSPFWQQQYDSRTDAVDMTYWTLNKDKVVNFECAKAAHYGLYAPGAAAPVWYSVFNATTVTRPAYDSYGVRAYYAARREVLPASCWNYDNVRNKWMTAIRAKQGNVIARGFEDDGLECLGQAVGETRRWFGWYNKDCVKTYSNSSNHIPFTIVEAES